MVLTEGRTLVLLSVLKQLGYFIEPRIIHHFGVQYLRSVNGDHSSLLILKVDFIYVKNMILKLNMRALKLSGLQIERFHLRDQ